MTEPDPMVRLGWLDWADVPTMTVCSDSAMPVGAAVRTPEATIDSRARGSDIVSRGRDAIAIVVDRVNELLVNVAMSLPPLD
ncbi:hypothetical protein [Microlunatus soli]|uniref:hypothetical protein n=1 Tax=Microlunatus soli TaxID=630515 RepID=UPI000B825F1A|nr:hypothetical protein [Microlunatus soli]